MHIKYCFIALLLFGSGLVAYTQEVDREILINDIKTLSSIEFAGRQPGTDGHKKALNYITFRFSELGLRAFRPDYTHVFLLNGNLTGHNVVGYIPGKRKETIVILPITIISGNVRGGYILALTTTPAVLLHYWPSLLISATTNLNTR